MTIIEAIILGLIQGLTEFIPVSSSGHIILAQHFLSGASDHLFVEAINIGTVIALLIYFWPRIKSETVKIIAGRDWRLATNIIVATIPVGVLGYVFATFIETNFFFASTWTVVATMVALGVVMIILEKLPRLSYVADGAYLSKNRALTIGIAQAAALIPGTSRSGATIVAGRLLGMNVKAAAEFSFLLSIPVMLGVLAKLFSKESDRAYMAANLEPLIVGNVVALISSLLAVGFLMRYFEKHDLAAFGWYRIGLGLVIALTLVLL